ncbi:MAG: prepilin peptidase [Bryobacteraceae bacterium]
MTPQAVLAGGIGIAACIDDLRRRQISNWISGSALASGLVLQTVQHGWRGAGSALLGTVAGAGVFLVFYLLGGMGGGDVKLMAGFGALLGAKRLFEAALWTAGCGGLMALAVIVTGLVRDLCMRRGSSEDAGAESVGRPSRRADSIPYAPAIAAGVWLSLVGAT